jgi:hypothetical protein
MVYDYERIIVKKEREDSEFLSDIDSDRKYSINTPKGDIIAFAYREKSPYLEDKEERNSITIRVIDKNEKRLFSIFKPYSIFLKKHVITSAEDENLGEINQKFSLYGKSFEILDERDNILLRCVSHPTHPFTFQVFDKDRKNLGDISKEWTGPEEDIYEDDHTFLIDIANNIDYTIKLLILAAGIAFDIEYFKDLE